MGLMAESQKILIIGNKLHGKTTLAKMICQRLPSAESHSTSSYLVYRLGLLCGVSEEEILKDKETYRPKLVELGNAMCDADAGCLVSLCLWSARSDVVIIDGVRRFSEFNNVKDWFDHVIWIDRPEQPLGLDNLELGPEQGTEIIVNDGSLDDLKAKAEEFLLKTKLL